MAPKSIPITIKTILIRMIRFFIVVIIVHTIVSGGVVAHGYTSDADLKKKLFRFGFSSNLFSGINENDAVAAIRIWTKAMSEDFGIPVDPKPLSFQSVSEIESAVQQEQVEMVCMLTEEYAQLKSLFPNERTLCGTRADSSLESYYLLTNKKDNYSAINALKNKTIGLVKDRGSELGTVWLDIYLLQSGLPLPVEFFEETIHAKRMDKLIYQLFFQQIDACVVPRNVFEILSQLNPQIGTTLNIMASSPPVVPVVFAFSVGSDNPIVKLTLSALSHLHKSPVGSQLLTLFKVERLKIESVSVLEGTFELITTHRKLTRKDLK